MAFAVVGEAEAEGGAENEAESSGTALGQKDEIHLCILGNFSAT